MAPRSFVPISFTGHPCLYNCAADRQRHRVPQSTNLYRRAEVVYKVKAFCDVKGMFTADLKDTRKLCVMEKLKRQPRCRACLCACVRVLGVCVCVSSLHVVEHARTGTGPAQQ